VKVVDQRERIDAAGTAVIVVHDRPARLREGLLRDLEVPYPVLIDREMASYRSWGLGRARRLKTYTSPKILLGYAARLLFRGERLMFGSDPDQLGGDFVVGPDGRLTYAHPQQGVNDRPPVGLLVRELERAARGQAWRPASRAAS
jgi:hypothetical protein